MSGNGSPPRPAPVNVTLSATTRRSVVLSRFKSGTSLGERQFGRDDGGQWWSMAGGTRCRRTQHWRRIGPVQRRYRFTSTGSGSLGGVITPRAGIPKRRGFVDVLGNTIVDGAGLMVNVAAGRVIYAANNTYTGATTIATSATLEIG